MRYGLFGIDNNFECIFGKGVGTIVKFDDGEIIIIVWIIFSLYRFGTVRRNR